MLKTPPGTERSQQLLREAKVLADRLDTGRNLLRDAFQKHSVARCFEIITLYSELSRELLEKAEELVLIQQFQLTGIKGFVRRNGRHVHIDEVLGEDVVEMDANTLILLEKVKTVFGDVPHDILKIVD